MASEEVAPHGLPATMAGCSFCAQRLSLPDYQVLGRAGTSEDNLCLHPLLLCLPGSIRLALVIQDAGLDGYLF